MYLGTYILEKVQRANWCGKIRWKTRLSTSQSFSILRFGLFDFISLFEYAEGVGKRPNKNYQTRHHADDNWAIIKFITFRTFLSPFHIYCAENETNKKGN